MNINFKQGSKAANGKDMIVFLIAACSSIGTIDASRADWFRAVKTYEALDEASKEYGNCVIIKSVLASEYDAFCQDAI